MARFKGKKEIEKSDTLTISLPIYLKLAIRKIQQQNPEAGVSEIVNEIISNDFDVKECIALVYEEYEQSERNKV